MAIKLVTVLALFLVIQVNSLKHLVQTNCRSYSNSCRTFNDYANDADTYFTSDSSFYFMKGTHHLNVTLSITNVANLSFVGDESDTIFSDGCSIIWTRSSKVSWTSINIIFNDTNQTIEKNAFKIKNSEIVVSNTLFSKYSKGCIFYSRAIQAINSSIELENCIFENGYHTFGGALYIEHSNITFCGHTVFQSSTAKLAGGAMYCNKSRVYFNGSGTFVGNRAGLGQSLSYGTAIYVSSTNISFKGYFNFNNNQLLQNYSHYNHGGTIATSSSSLTMQGVFYFINNLNIYGGALFLNNTKCLISGQAAFVGNEAINNGGAINARSSSLILQSDELYNSSASYSRECFHNSYNYSILFCNNSAGELGGAVHLNESNMTLTGSVNFVANQAQSGGGISTYYNSEPGLHSLNFISFQEPLNLTFYANIAKTTGGAMYINDVYLNNRLCEYVEYSFHRKKLISCFFALNGSVSLIDLNFTSNKALAGEGIYGGAIKYCSVEVFKLRQAGYLVLQELIKYSTKIENLYANLDVLEIRYCINGTTPDLYNQSVDIRVQRGQVFNISVTVLGEFHFPISERVVLAINSDIEKNTTQIFGEPYNYLKEKGCRNIGFIILSELQREEYTLHSPQCLHESSILTMNVYLNDCPSGFVLTDNTCKCQKMFFRVTGHENLCDSSTGLIKCPQQDWMKPILDENLTYQGFMWSPNCPVHLCRNDKDNWIDFSSGNVDFLCLDYHTAMLCGACLQNYSLTLSSLKCSKCNSNNYLSLLLVFTLAGVALITSLLLLHMTVADGTINGLILYANVINIIKDLIFPQDQPPNPLTLIISWLNLDFGIPTCFYTGLNYYSYTWLQFVFPFYLWFLVGLIILACKYSSRAMKLFGSNPVAVLATVVLMSYNKLLHTSQQILSYVTVYYSNGTQEKRWKIDPNLLYLQGKHIPLAMFGMFIVIVFLIPYIVLIFFGRYLQKYSHRRGLNWLIKIKPILDAYYAPFCKNTRYWVGLMLIARTCVSITYSTLENTEHTTILVIVSSVLTGISLIPWLQHKIYEKTFVSVLEGSFILNVIILSIATYHASRENKNHQLIISYTSVGVAFIEFLAILAFHARHRMNLKWLNVKYCKFWNASANSSVPSKVMDPNKSGGNALTTMVIDIREPLLEDSI